MIQAIIIDDEIKAINALERIIEKKFTEIQIVATAQSADLAIELIKLHDPDLIFLDIEMPNKTGFEILEAVVSQNFSVIFTTAYNQYAIKAIRYSALDYLLKPISEEELFNAINRYKEKNKSNTQHQQFNMLFDNLKNLSSSYSKITVSTTQGVLFLNVNEIIYCQAESSYTSFHMKNKETIVSSKTLKDFEELLSEYSFFRIHHGFLINIHEIKRYIKGEGGSVLMNNGAELPVSKRKKDDFLKKLKL